MQWRITFRILKKSKKSLRVGIKGGISLTVRNFKLGRWPWNGMAIVLRIQLLPINKTMDITAYEVLKG
jgi:hypothetical protein